MKKPRILYFIQLPLPVHGVSVMNELIYNSDRINKNYEKHLIEIKFSSQFSEIRRYNLNKILKFFTIAIRLFANLNKIKSDIVYFSLMPVGPGFVRDFFYVIIIRLFNLKIIFHLHNIGINERSKKPLFKWMYESIFKNSTIIHPSDILLRKELKNLNLVNTKKIVIPNTCMPFSNSNINSQRSNNDIIRILFFSNLLPDKGLMVLLEAIKNVSDNLKNFELNVYGSYYRAREVKRYKRFISENNLSEKVFIKGPCFNREKERAFCESDIFVFPSYFREECFPLVILEAMQAGLAIITSSIGAIPEIIEDGINGILVKPKEHLQLAEKIQLLATNKKLRKSIGNKARDKYLKQYSFRIFESNMYNTLLKYLGN
jgi:glycosyltransferase involved in cell wall biosynthesis